MSSFNQMIQAQREEVAKEIGRNEIKAKFDHDETAGQQVVSLYREMDRLQLIASTSTGAAKMKRTDEKSHSLYDDQSDGVTNWKLDTDRDGLDAILEGPYDQVVRDVLHHHDLAELPAHWKIRPAAAHEVTRTDFTVEVMIDGAWEILCEEWVEGDRLPDIAGATSWRRYIEETDEPEYLFEGEWYDASAVH